MTMTTDTCKCGHPQGRHARLAGTYAHCIQKNPDAAYGRCGCGMYRPQDAEPAAAPFAPPAADGLPLAALDSATDGASALDAWARDPHGRNLLAHALVQLARDGWLRTEPGHGFEPVLDRETPEPEDPAELRRKADEAQQAEPETVSEPFIYTDADAAKLAIGAQDDGGRPVVSVVADEGARGHAAVYVLPEDIEHVVAALRDARRNAQALHDEAQQAREAQR